MKPPTPDLNVLDDLLRADASRRLVLRRMAGGLAALAVMGGPASGALARQATPAPSSASPDPYRFSVGAFTLTAVSDGIVTIPNEIFPVPPQQLLFVDAPPEELEAALRAEGFGDWIDAPESISEPLSFTPLVVETGENVVLIDTGLGPASPFPGGGLLPAALSAAGFDPAAIDTVFFTHGHPDHVLGAIDASGAAAFPNARYAMPAADHAFWTDADRLAAVFPSPEAAAEAAGAFQAVLPAIESRLDLVDEAVEAEIVPGLRAVAAYGHTPGHAAVVVASEGEQLLVTGDVLIHPLHVTYPDWNFVNDTLPSQTDATRRGLLDRAADQEMLVQIYHAPFPGLGRVVPDGARLRWEPVP